MANDWNLTLDIMELQRNKKTRNQGVDLSELYFCKYVENNPKKLEKLKKLYVKKYGFLDNYV